MGESFSKVFKNGLAIVDMKTVRSSRDNGRRVHTDIYS